MERVIANIESEMVKILLIRTLLIFSQKDGFFELNSIKIEIF